jgi:hypothetical protein
MRKFALWGLVALVALPPIFVFCAVQYAAVTLPYWDHVELGRMIVDYRDGHMAWSQLWAGHNHDRPLTYRVLLLLNAIATGWDLRSEYVYMFGAIYGAFALQAYALWRALGRSGTAFLPLLLVVSIVAFSPAGQHNHWWSMMLELNLAHLFVLAALIAVACSPRTWGGNLLAAACCWLATYTLTNGLVAFVAAMLISQMAQPRPLRPSRFLLFWLANFALVLRLYLPGLPEPPGHLPAPGRLAHFSLAYLGSPLASLFHFPYRDHLDCPADATRLNTAMGALLLAGAAVLAWRLRRLFNQGRPGALLFAGFALLGIGSSLATGWARADFNAAGIINANASRYTLFASYLIVGIVMGLAEVARVTREAVVADTAPAPGRAVRWAGMAALGLLTLLGGLTYVRSVHVYRAAHRFNLLLAAAFADPGPSNLDASIYPSLEVTRALKANLKRLHLGPYRGQP